MELEFPSSILFASLVIFLFILLKIGKKSKTKHTTLNLPPGPWKLPLIGNLHQLVGSLPHHQLRDLVNKYGPLIHLQLGQVSTIVVSSPEFAKQVMKTHETIFATRATTLAIKIITYDCKSIGLVPYGDYWRQLRKLCMNQLLSPTRVQYFRSIREEEVSDLGNWIASKAGSPINFTNKFHLCTSNIITRAAFGKKCKDREKFTSILKKVVTLAAGFNIADLFPSIKLLQWINGIKSQLEEMHQENDRILENIMDEHRQRKAINLEFDNHEENKDLVDVLLKIQEHGHSEFRPTTDDIKAIIWEIFSAGSDSSVTVVDWAMAELMKNPTILKKAQDEVGEVFNKKAKVDETSINEMTFLKLVIKETMRLHTPAPLLVPRQCAQNCVINGFDIPIGAKIIVNAWAIARSPEYWTQPESFIPERFIDSSIDYMGANFDYIPFGSGKRICAGIRFALTNVELQLVMLLYHFDWKLPNGMKHQDLDMTEAFSISTKRKDDLWLIPIPYHPSHVS
ncbi:hypothetical protein Ddye_022803 [Dipteronia dyeriana]|uniref:Cytochrome P450 n=1 Tax=Dipteronia dyeriana TaxID=168575 RepID=A0AAD9WST0_9ROSI|nr:hypothetical protein Ddye_022803 [Dipteronia dyeriana]